MMSGRELFIAGSADDLAREAASRFVEAANRAMVARGRFSVALSGGSTPRKLYTLLTQSPFRQAVDWTRVNLFFADERHVPADHPDSTALLVRETLLAGVPVPDEQVFVMPCGDITPEGDAATYTRTLEAFFGSGLPRFDLMLLGMGPDGHTASLFPGYPDYPGTVAAVHDSPKPPPIRLTLTLPVINQAREILFLVTGADKAQTLKVVFESSPSALDALPAARVMPVDGALCWLIDPAAAADLPETLRGL